MFKTGSDGRRPADKKREKIDPRQRLLDAAIALLAEVKDPDSLTVRQIADRAKVGVGLLNYHFGSKESLLDQAIGELMQRDAGLRGAPPRGDAGSNPAEKVRSILKQTSNVGLRFPNLTRMLAKRTLLGGDYGPERILLPLLREHFATALSEPEIRVTAIQIVAPLQIMATRAKDFEKFTGLDFLDEAVVDRVIDRLVDNILK